MTNLGTLLGGMQSFGNAINNAGQVVGGSDTTVGVCSGCSTTHGFIWSDGTMTDLGSLGGGHSFGRAINDVGEVVGESTTVPGGRSPCISMEWRGDDGHYAAWLVQHDTAGY